MSVFFKRGSPWNVTKLPLVNTVKTRVSNQSPTGPSCIRVELMSQSKTSMGIAL